MRCRARRGARRAAPPRGPRAAAPGRLNERARSRRPHEQAGDRPGAATRASAPACADRAQRRRTPRARARAARRGRTPASATRRGAAAAGLGRAARSSSAARGGNEVTSPRRVNRPPPALQHANAEVHRLPRRAPAQPDGDVKSAAASPRARNSRARGPSRRARPRSLPANGTSVIGDQNASTNAASEEHDCRAVHDAHRRPRGRDQRGSCGERAPGAMSAEPSLKPAAPESTMAVSSSAQWPETNDQKVRVAEPA